jgi:hypothetical protein
MVIPALLVLPWSIPNSLTQQELARTPEHDPRESCHIIPICQQVFTIPHSNVRQ